MAKIKVNGVDQDIDLSRLIIDIIRQNSVLQLDMVTVQLNGEFVFRDKYESTFVKDGDEIDFLYFMGGGSK